MSRAERVAEARQLREEGLKQSEIADRMGAPRTTVSTWLLDPDLSRQRARRATYAGRCVDCGKPTDGSGGPNHPRKRCVPCAAAHSVKWTDEAIIAAIRLFADRYGQPPAATDFNPAHARARRFEARAERFIEDGDYPYSSLVLRNFGSWNAGIAAAGFQPTPQGRRAYLPVELDREAAA